MKDTFKVDGLNVAVSVGNTGLIVQVEGELDGEQVLGHLYYGMTTEDANVLEPMDGTWSSDLAERVLQEVDNSPDFNEWANWAMQNTPI